MSEPVILFVKPQAIKATDKKALRSAGVIVVEIENPSDAKLVRATSELSSTDLLSCAATAIGGASYDEVRVRFAKAICKAIEASSPPTSPQAKLEAERT